MLDLLLEVNNAADFERSVLEGEQPRLVVFYSTHSPSCRHLAGEFSLLATEYGGYIRFLRVNVDESPELEQLFEVRVLPTVILFDRGEMVKRWDSELRMEHYRNTIESIITHGGFGTRAA